MRNLVMYISVIMLCLSLALFGCGKHKNDISRDSHVSTEIDLKEVVIGEEVVEQNDVVINSDQTVSNQKLQNEELFDSYEETYDMIIARRDSFSTAKDAYKYISSVYEEQWPGEYGYQLINFDDDDEQELVVCPYDYPFFSMYSYKAGAIYPLINMWSTGNSQEDCFLERNGVIRSFRKSGESKESVFIIKETNEGILDLDYELVMESKGEEQSFYLFKDGKNEPISEEKYDELWLENENFTLFDGDKSFDELW